MALFSGLLEKLARPPEEIRAENLRAWAASIPGVAPIDRIELRKRCKTAGVVQNIRIDPREGRGAIEATLTDGTGQIVARWLGRSSLSGISLGTGLIVEGTVGRGPEGDLVVLNPDYELVPGPEHG